ncbi:ATP synthase F1 subunit delta [bacterium]|nr:ATP synthase F1 subunit delta [bacterium]
MRITPKQYAKLLLEMLYQQDEVNIKIEIGKFIKLLIHKNELKNYQKIIKEFIKLWNKKEGIIEAEIFTARPINDDLVDYMENFIKKRTGAKKIKLENKIDENLISGALIKYGDRILDNTLKTKINDLKINMIK